MTAYEILTDASMMRNDRLLIADLPGHCPLPISDWWRLFCELFRFEKLAGSICNRKSAVENRKSSNSLSSPSQL